MQEAFARIHENCSCYAKARALSFLLRSRVEERMYPMLLTGRARMVSLCIQVSVLCLLIGGCIEDKRADKAFQRGDYRKTAQELRYLAEHGDVRAQYDLGLL